MNRRATVAALVTVTVAACGGGGGDDGDADDKRVRQSASVSLAGDVAWVAGGAEGPLDELSTGMAFGPGSEWALATAVVGYDVDGNEVARVDVHEEGVSYVNAVVVNLDGLPILIGGQCAAIGLGCNGPTTPLLATMALDESGGGIVEPIDVDADGGAVPGPARLAGVAAGAAWVVVDDGTTSLLVRVDASGAFETSSLPEFVWTGDVCVDEAGLVAAVSVIEEGTFVARELALWRRGFDAGDEWTRAGTVDLADLQPNGVRMHCVGGGELLLDLADAGHGPVVVRVDDGAVVADAPEELRGGAGAVVVSDPAGGVAAAARTGAGSVEPVFAYRAGDGWAQVGEVRTPSDGQPPALAVGDGVVRDLTGARQVAGVGAPSVGALP